MRMPRRIRLARVAKRSLKLSNIRSLLRRWRDSKHLIAAFLEFVGCAFQADGVAHSQEAFSDWIHMAGGYCGHVQQRENTRFNSYATHLDDRADVKILTWRHTLLKSAPTE